MCQVRLLELHPVELGRIDVRSQRTVLVRSDDELLSIRQRDGGAIKQRAAKDVFRRARTHRIKTNGAEYIPCGHLARIFITAETIRSGVIQPAHRFADASL